MTIVLITLNEVKQTNESLKMMDRIFCIQMVKVYKVHIMAQRSHIFSQL